MKLLPQAFAAAGMGHSDLTKLVSQDGNLSGEVARPRDSWPEFAFGTMLSATVTLFADHMQCENGRAMGSRHGERKLMPLP